MLSSLDRNCNCVLTVGVPNIVRLQYLAHRQSEHSYNFYLINSAYTLRVNKTSDIGLLVQILSDYNNFGKNICEIFWL